MHRELWKERCNHRMDITSTLTHLTREGRANGQELSALEMLVTILREQRIKGSARGGGVRHKESGGLVIAVPKTSFIVGDRPAVCFFDAPLIGLAQNIWFEQQTAGEECSRVRYRGVGLVFDKQY